MPNDHKMVPIGVFNDTYLKMIADLKDSNMGRNKSNLLYLIDEINNSTIDTYGVDSINELKNKLQNEYKIDFQEKIREIQSSSTEYYVFFTCQIFNDGYGDASHLIDAINLFNEAMKDHPLRDKIKPYFFIFVDDVMGQDKAKIEERRKIIFSILSQLPGFPEKLNVDDMVGKEKGKIIQVAENIHIAFNFDETKQIKPYFAKKLEKTLLVMNASTNEYLSQFTDFTHRGAYPLVTGDYIPVLYLGETGHGPFMVPAGFSNLSYGLGTYSNGIIIRPPRYKSKTDAFNALTDTKLKLALLDSKDEKITKTDTDNFFKNTLFIPAYYKSSAIFFIYLAGILTSPWFKSSSYETMTFLVSNNIFSENKLDPFKDPICKAAFEKLLKQSGISQIEYSAEADKPSTVIIFGDKGKKLRILKRWLAPNEHELLYEIATVFGGTSGDKTLQLCFANHLIPLYEVIFHKIVKMVLHYEIETDPRYQNSLLKKLIVDSFQNNGLSDIKTVIPDYMYDRSRLKPDSPLPSLWDSVDSKGPIVNHLYNCLSIDQLIMVGHRIGPCLTKDAVTDYLANESTKLVKELNCSEPLKEAMRLSIDISLARSLKFNAVRDAFMKKRKQPESQTAPPPPTITDEPSPPSSRPKI